jgi:uncharacterized protein (TIGR01777 family)
MRAAITGATGFLGRALTSQLGEQGWETLPISRSSRTAIPWSPEGGFSDAEALRNLDVVIHLAGESVVGRWSAEKKQRVWDSRVISTQAIAKQLADLPAPKTFVVASAVGYYGDRGDETLTEDSDAGQGFLAKLAVAWEAAAEPARQAGHRVVHLRTGIVLSPDGGALAQMLPIFRLGLGGRLGSGRQYMPWISLRDWVAMAVRAVSDESWIGPFNLTAPSPVRNAEFTRALAKALRRPAVFAVPRFALRAIYGEFADEGLLASQRAIPAKALQAGFSFQDEEIDATLERLLRA